MFALPIGVIDGWIQDYQTISYGNYGYGVYSQDFEVRQNPFTGRLKIDQNLGFIPLRSASRSYGDFRPAIHQHYFIYKN